jgi:hypothetical protein
MYWHRDKDSSRAKLKATKKLADLFFSWAYWSMGRESNPRVLVLLASALAASPLVLLGYLQFFLIGRHDQWKSQYAASGH